MPFYAGDRIRKGQHVAKLDNAGGEFFELLVSIGISVVFQDDEQFAILRQDAHRQAFVNARRRTFSVTFAFRPGGQVAG